MKSIFAKVLTLIVLLIGSTSVLAADQIIPYTQLAFSRSPTPVKICPGEKFNIIFNAQLIKQGPVVVSKSNQGSFLFWTSPSPDVFKYGDGGEKGLKLISTSGSLLPMGGTIFSNGFNLGYFESFDGRKLSFTATFLRVGATEQKYEFYTNTELLYPLVTTIPEWNIYLPRVFGCPVKKPPFEK